MSELTPLREAVDTLAGRTSPPDFGELERRATRRGRRRVVMVAAATAAVVAGSALALSGLGDDRRSAPPVQQPKPVVVAVPVWYDANGLHRGHVVEKTPIKIGQPVTYDTLTGALALVRSGAVYVDGPVGDVWFHPWGGEPRIVGHNSEAGPGGDPNGDIAVWFEGSDADTLPAGPGELVVYDTAAGREISRTIQSHGVAYSYRQLLSAGNEFLQVSAERVVWSSGHDLYSHDVRSRTTSVVKAPGILEPLDVHDQIEVFWEDLGASSNVVLRVPGRADERFSDMSPDVLLSPSGNYLLALESTETPPAAVMIDTRTGELWRLPKNVYPVIAWSYGDLAMVDNDGTRPIGERADVAVKLLACDAARRACEPLPAERGFLLPTN
jgi:hypothetical protein